jgi:LuxR family maltose regulon positive regulatory protein
MTINILSEFADLQLTQGKLRASHETCQAALALGGETKLFSGLHLPIMGMIYGRLSAIQREWNNLQDAVKHARLGLEISRRWGHTVAAIIGCEMLSLALMHAGEHESAIQTLQQAEELAGKLSPDVQMQVQALMARLHLMSGDVQSAVSWGKTAPFDKHAEHLHPIWAYIILARTQMASGDLSGAEILVKRLLTKTRAIKAAGFVIELLVLKAVLMHFLGKEQEALEALENALKHALPEGYERVFLAEGKVIETLLQTLIKVKGPDTYSSKLAHAFRVEEIHTGEVITAELVEPLSKREMEVLRLLATSLPPDEIASELFIAVSTVKSHIKNIYAKLGVHRRYEAVQRAQDLNLM